VLGRGVRLLIESILHEFLLQPEILELLRLFPLALQIRSGVHDAQLADLFALGLLH